MKKHMLSFLVVYAIFFVLVSVFAAEHETITRVRGYLVLNGQDSDLVNGKRGGPVSILVDKNGNVAQFYWDTIRLGGLPKPVGGLLPDLETAEAALVQYEADKKAEELAEQQAKKPAKLKGHELKVRTFLRSEGVISTNENFPTSGQLEAMFAAWDELQGNQGDAKASKYERLMRPVRLFGGDDLGGYGGD